MTAKSFDDLLAAGASLKPVPVSIEGLDDQVLIHQFTWDQFRELFESDKPDDDADQEAHIRTQVLKLLRGPDCEPTAEDCASLGKIFTVAQVREIYNKGLRLNGFGAAALRDAEKK